MHVETVRGPVPADELGITLMHEHVFLAHTEIERNFRTGWDEEEQVGIAVQRLRSLREQGVRTIVDVTAPGLGRDVARVLRVAEQVDVHIVVATGYYTITDLPSQFVFNDPDGPFGGRELLTDFFVDDLRAGVAGLPPGVVVRPGIIKVATDEPGFTPGVRRVLRAAAQAHLATGVPITTHSNAHLRQGLEQQRILADEGVDLRSVVIGHSGDSADLEYLVAMLEQGSTLGMDRFGLYGLCSFEDRVRTVAALCAQGWAAQLVLSHDTCCRFHWMEPERLDRFAPDWRLTHLMADVVPALRRAGVTEADLDAMLVEAPRRILTAPLRAAAPQPLEAS